MSAKPRDRSASTPSAHTLPGVHALHLVELVARWQVTPADLLAGSELSQASLSDPATRLPMPTFERLIERARELTGEPGLGFHLGLSMRISAHGHLGFAAMTATTLGDALEIAVRFAPTRTTAHLAASRARRRSSLRRHRRALPLRKRARRHRHGAHRRYLANRQCPHRAIVARRGRHCVPRAGLFRALRVADAWSGAIRPTATPAHFRPVDPGFAARPFRSGRRAARARAVRARARSDRPSRGGRGRRARSSLRAKREDFTRFRASPRKCTCPCAR